MTLRQDYTTEKEIESGSKTVDLSNILTSKKGEMNLPLEYAAGIGYALMHVLISASRDSINSGQTTVMIWLEMMVR